MNTLLHITNGDSAGERLAKAGLPGEILVWRDVLYDGPRNPGWPTDGTLHARAEFLSHATVGGLSERALFEELRHQYDTLANMTPDQGVVLWFDACLFDQAMLAHILTCLQCKGVANVELLCVDAFPGIEPFHGLGQLQADQLAALYKNRQPVTDEAFRFAETVDKAFATQDQDLFAELIKMSDAPLPWVPAAVARWQEEQPNAVTGLGKLESLALAAIREGCATPKKVFSFVSAADTPPQFWGDTTLWAKINGLADRVPPLVQIEGPANRLPQWGGDVSLDDFSILALPAD
jgi:hypothetical protein